MKTATLAALETATRFIAAAVSRDATRYFMTSAYFDAAARALVATDGRRMHIVYLSEYECSAAGLTTDTYVTFIKQAPFIAPVKIDAQFPNWRKVLPDAAPRFTLDTDINSSTGWQSALAIKLQAILNIDHLKPLAGNDWRVTPGSAYYKAVRFDYYTNDDDASPRATCVIMPMGNDTRDDFAANLAFWCPDITKA